MRYKILNYISTHDKCRVHDIIKYCHTDIESKSFNKQFYDLYHNGFIDCIYSYFASNLDWFNRWSLTDKGRKAIIKRNKKLKKRKNKTLDKLNKV